MLCIKRSPAADQWVRKWSHLSFQQEREGCLSTRLPEPYINPTVLFLPDRFLTRWVIAGLFQWMCSCKDFLCLFEILLYYRALHDTLLKNINLASNLLSSVMVVYKHLFFSVFLPPANSEWVEWVWPHFLHNRIQRSGQERDWKGSEEMMDEMVIANCLCLPQQVQKSFQRDERNRLLS